MRRIDLAPRKQPRQKRSQVLVEVILEAATRVLSREGLAGYTTNRVAEVAGVSVGSLYQYFPNKDALTAALIDRTQARVADAVAAEIARAEGQPFEATLRALARLAIAQQYAEPALAAALDQEERRLPVQPMLSSHRARMLQAIDAFLARHAAVDGSPPPRAATDLLLMTKALVEADVETSAGTPSAPPADLEDRVVRALLGYLRLPGTAGAQSRA